MNFLHTGPEEKCNLKSVLFIEDDLSSYTWFYPYSSADGDIVKSTFAKWIACFESKEMLVMDQSSRFIAALMTSLTKDARTLHHFTTTYCLWSSSTIKRLCKESSGVAKELLSKRNILTGKWSTSIEARQKVVTKAPSKRFGKNARQSTVFSGSTHRAKIITVVETILAIQKV